MRAEQLRLQSLTGISEKNNVKIDVLFKYTAFAVLRMDSHHNTFQAECFIAMRTCVFA